MRGASLSLVGPATSAWKSCMPPICSMGRMASPRTMIPMPPSQWVRARQKLMLGGMTSTSMMILDPVVVKPDMDSKKASTNDGMTSDRRKGRAPRKEMAIQLSTTMTKPSLVPISVVGRKGRISARPRIIPITEERTKAMAVLSPKMKLTGTGVSSSRETARSSLPSRLRTPLIRMVSVSDSLEL